jgi:hypothetical protein
VADDTQPQPNQSEQPQGAPTGETPVAPAQPVSFEEWYKTLAPEQQEALDVHIDGLKTALKGERDGRKTLEKQLRDLAKNADEGSELRQQLDKLATEQALTNAKASFYEAAHAANVKNLRLAWLAAQDASLVDARTGEADLKALREVAPELFIAKPAPSVNAGNGAGQNGVREPSMNDFLRASRGR